MTGFRAVERIIMYINRFMLWVRKHQLEYDILTADCVALWVYLMLFFCVLSNV
jgi:hypothetical protein